MPPGTTSARVMPSTRVTGIAVDERVEGVNDVERGAEPRVGAALIRRPFGRERDLDDPEIGVRLDEAGRDDLAGARR